MDDLFLELHNVLKSAVKNHHTYLSNHCHDLYGYVLYADDPLWGWRGRFNCESNLKDQLNTPDYFVYRYVATEWEGWLSRKKELEMFNKVPGILENIRGKQELFENTDVYKTILATCYNVLFELEAEGLFGERDDTRYLAIFLSDSDDEIIPRSIREFNSPKAAAEALGCMIFDDL